MTYRIEVKRGTAAEWVASNRVLAAGEIGFESDSNKIKVGNGTSGWNALSYVAGSGSGTATIPAGLTAIETVSETTSTGVLTKTGANTWTLASYQSPITTGTSSQVLRGDLSLATLNTSIVPEGTNVYWTSGRFDTAFSSKTTDNLAEGSNHVYFTAARHDFATLANKPTTLAGYGITDAQAKSADLTAIAALNGIGLLRRTGNTTWTLDITAYEPLVSAGTQAQYYRGDKTWQTLNTACVPESANLYFTASRVRSTVLQGLVADQGYEITPADTLLAGIGKLWGKDQDLQAQLDSDVANLNSWVTIFDGRINSLTTDNIAEGARQYFTQARVRTSPLTGLSTATSTAVVAGDTVLGGIGKLQAQINTEVTARTAACATLTTNLNSEITSRTAADNTLQNNITAVQANVGVEATLRAAADTALTNSLNSEITNRQAAINSAISSEVSSRNAAIAALTTTNIPEGTNKYVTSSNVLSTVMTGQSAVVAPYTILQDTDTLAQYLAGLKFYIDSESTTRAAQDALEATTRASAITALQNSKEPSQGYGTTSQYWRGDKTWAATSSLLSTAILTGLSTTTSSAVVATDTVVAGIGKLQAQLNTEVTARAAAVSAEATSRDAAISAAISAEVTARNAAIDAKAASYVLPVATSSTLGGVKPSSGLTLDADGTLYAARTLYFNGPASAITLTSSAQQVSGSTWSSTTSHWDSTRAVRMTIKGSLNVTSTTGGSTVTIAAVLGNLVYLNLPVTVVSGSTYLIDIEVTMTSTGTVARLIQAKTSSYGSTPTVQWLEDHSSLYTGGTLYGAATAKADCTCTYTPLQTIVEMI